MHRLCECVAVCPGLACFVVDLTWGDEHQALMKIPYEMLPIPSEERSWTVSTGKARP